MPSAQESPQGCIEIIESRSAEEFLTNLRPSHPRWKSDSLQSAWLFRGQGDASRSLVPSAWRRTSDSNSSPNADLRRIIRSRSIVQHQLAAYSDLASPPFPFYDELKDRWKGIADAVRYDRIKAWVEQVLYEIQLLKDFWLIADDVGHVIEPPTWIDNNYGLTELLRQTVDGTRESFFESILTATAQHHGVPTRFLDWSKDPMVAAFFAANEVPDTAEAIAVWAVRRKVVKESRLREFGVPRYALPFLHAQSGLFLWDPDAAPEFAISGEWTSQLDVLVQGFAKNSKLSIARPWIYKLVVPVSTACEVTEILWHERISKSHLMPTLDNVAHALWTTSRWRGTGSFLG